MVATVKRQALSIERAIELVQSLQPWTYGRHALFALVAEQAEPITITAEKVRDAFAGVAAGESLPPLGLTHIGVQVVQAFEAADWALVLPPLRAVAAGKAPPQFGYAVDTARRLVATHEVLGLPESAARDFVLGVIDPTIPPVTPDTFAWLEANTEVCLAAVRALLRDAPTARPFVDPVLAPVGRR